VVWHRELYAYHAIQKESNDHSVYRRPSRTCITSRSLSSQSYVPPATLYPPARRLSLFLSPVFPRSRSNALPAGNRRSGFSLPVLPFSYPLYTRECTPEARFKDRHASTFSYTYVHLGGPASTTDTTPRRLHHPLSSSACRVSRSFPLSLSLSRSPFGLTPLYPSRSRSPLHSPLLRGHRLSMSREKSRRQTTGELAEREIGMFRRCTVCPCSVAREPQEKAEPRRRWYNRSRCTVRAA